MDPMSVKILGPPKDMSFLCTHVFRWTQKPHVYWWTQKIIKGPLKDMRFWVHQKIWGFSRVMGPSKDISFRGENFEKICTNWVHQKTWDFERGKSWFGSIKRHEIFGSINRHEVVKNGQNMVGSIKRNECPKVGSHPHIATCDCTLQLATCDRTSQVMLLLRRK